MSLTLAAKFMENIAKPWMLAYTIVFGLLSVSFVHNNVENRYHIIYIIWSAIFYILVFAGNLIYSIGLLNLKIRKIWKLIFPIIILEFIFSDIVDFLYGTHVRNADESMKTIAVILDFALFFPTFWAHYKISYGKEGEPNFP